MRIQQFGDSVESAPNPLIEIGRIAVGCKASNGQGVEFPKSTDHFVIRSDFNEQVLTAFGEKPTKLSILFISDDEEFSCNERLEIRDHKGDLYGYGDGETFWFYHQQQKSYSIVKQIAQRPALMNETVAYLQRGLSPKQAKTIAWKEVLYLRFLVRDFPLLGFWQFSSHGAKTTIPGIRRIFDNCIKTFGTVQNIPFLLRVKVVQSNQPDTVKRFPVVELIPHISLEEGYRRVNRPSPILSTAAEALLLEEAFS